MKGRVVAHIFTESKASWEEETGNRHNHPGTPEDMHAFLKSLSNEN